MKINYFFPFFKQDNAKECLENFKQTKFYNEHKLDSSFVFVCKKDDKKNFNYLSTVVNAKDKLLIIENEFTYNDAFYYSLKYFNCDILLLSDAKIKRIDIAFSKCLQKYEKGAKVVHFVKKATGFKGFFVKILHNLYNTMIKIFTGKKDRLNIISLGLIDANVLDLLKELPRKCCFLKNTKQLYGFETRSIYVDNNIKTYKPKYSKITEFLKMSYWFLGISIGLVGLLILLNCFIKTNLTVYNIVGVLTIVVLVLSALIALPKHFFDIRNTENRKVNLVVKEFKIKEQITNESKEKVKNKKSVKVKDVSKVKDNKIKQKYEKTNKNLKQKKTNEKLNNAKNK